MAPRNRKWLTDLFRRLLSCSLLVHLLAPQVVWGAPVSETEQVSVPAVFSEPVPRTLDDLKAIQNHVTRLVPRLSAATVSVKVGRNQGSGVIVTADGLVLTAAHVSGKPGNAASIILSDGQRLNGTVLGRNDTLDASMIRLQSTRTDWPHCPLAREAPHPGDWCLAMGHPGGYIRGREPSVRLGRLILINSWMVQTDCDLVGGDSGGPLLDMQGRVIGINTRIGDRTDYNFHIPGQVFVRDWDRLVAGDDFRSHSGAYLGVVGDEAPGRSGLLIKEIVAGNAAERADLRVGDVILEFEGKPVTNLKELSEYVGQEPPGKAVNVRYSRQGEVKEVKVRLGMRWD
ncbi:S1C family serine protease [Planctomicrobium sp. SH664]|uniref:S1C family serine protease n=1 Tax=Planctomicrobium sp. SH664 TaxID=3448125 RepID=UPI003F5C36DE